MTQIFNETKDNIEFIVNERGGNRATVSFSVGKEDSQYEIVIEASSDAEITVEKMNNPEEETEKIEED